MGHLFMNNQPTQLGADILSLATPKPIPKRRLDNWLQSFIQYASHGEAPEGMLFWTGISTIAGALGRKTWIDMGYFQWVPNFYIILVANPGIVSKSTTASIGMNLLREVPGMKFGPDVVTWPALVQAMAEARQQFLNPDTGEYTDMCAMTIASSEFGNLFNPQDREMVDIFVSLWDGQTGTFEKKTKTNGTDLIVNPWINVIAATTPAWIAGNVPEYMIGGGFTSRTMFIYAEKKRQLVAYPILGMNEDTLQLKEDLIHDLEAISMISGEMTLTPEALEWGTAWYNDHWNRPEQHAHLDSNQFGGYLARKQTHLHKLAIILSAAESAERKIEQRHLEAAAQIVTSTEKDAKMIFGKIGMTESSRLQNEIVDYVQRNGKIRQEELFKKMFKSGSKFEFDNALKGAAGAGFVSLLQQGSTIWVSPA